MAYLLKNQNSPKSVGPTRSGESIVAQTIHVSVAKTSLPQTSTDQLFRVKGGRVLVQKMMATCTTAIQSTDPVLKISSKALSTADVAIGTAVDIATTADTKSQEVGAHLFVEGDGTAIVLSVAGCTFVGTNSGKWIANAGEIYMTTGASKTGAYTWDLWYTPLDPGAYVVSAGAVRLAAV